jgi:hypothetical protein
MGNSALGYAGIQDYSIWSKYIYIYIDLSYIYETQNYFDLHNEYNDSEWRRNQSYGW